MPEGALGWPRGAVSGGLRWAKHSILGEDVVLGTADPGGVLYQPGRWSTQWPVGRVGAAVWTDASGTAFVSGGYNPAARCDMADLWVVDTHDPDQVRETPCRPSSWANFSLS
jgi:hypothetical protein